LLSVNEWSPAVKLFRVTLFAILFVLAGSAAHLGAQQPVTFPSGDSTGQGLLYLPHGAGPHAALIVIHEWWGLNDWIKHEAAGYASQGYVALAVDLYHGKVADTADLAHELSRGLPEDQGVRDLRAAFQWLRARKDVDPSRIGAVGWCMGGGFAIELAVAAPDLKAVAVNYGALPTDKSALARIHAAVLGNFGGEDRGIPPDAVHAFDASMRSLGKPVNVKIYPDAGHAFENPNNSTGYRPADAADALVRIDRFFAQTLKP
jgi:carboxymethylenebutenolidase